MAKKHVLKFLILVLSVPFVLLSRIAEILDVWGIRTEICKCLDVIDSSGHEVPLPFITTLISAEDHRSNLHKGVDPIAMIRAAYIHIRFGQVQGASTIEQQFVRVATGRYERTLDRKVREQLLAIAVSRRRSKQQIASTYLSIAFYGFGCFGINGLHSRCGNELAKAGQYKICSIIARLKYPEPLQPTLMWQRKLLWRIKYIRNREEQSANNWLRPIAYVADAPSASA